VIDIEKSRIEFFGIVKINKCVLKPINKGFLCVPECVPDVFLTRS